MRLALEPVACVGGWIGQAVVEAVEVAEVAEAVDPGRLDH